MWPFGSGKDEEEIGKYDTPINKARPVSCHEEKKTIDFTKIPMVYGIILSGRNTIGIGNRPRGTHEENNFYMNLFRPPIFISRKTFSSEEEGYDFLFSKEQTLSECGIYLDGGCTEEKLRRVIYPKEK